MSKAKYFILLLPFFFLSCVDEDSQLGLGLVDSSDRVAVKTYGNFDINACVFHEGDSLKTSDYRYMTLGSYADPVFGNVTPSIYTQVSLSNSSIDFSSYGQIDSIVLTLAYNGCYFGTNSSTRVVKEQDMILNVYQLTENFDDSAAYYANSTLAHSYNIIRNKEVKVSPYKNVIVKTNSENDTLAPQLRVKLPSSFLNKLISYGSFTTNSSFVQAFKGLYITLTPKQRVSNGGMIAYIDMYSSASGLSMYYKDNSAKTQKYSFVFESGSRRFTHINYNFSSCALSYFSNHLHSSDSVDCSVADSKLYVASQGISYAKINIADLTQWFKDSTQNLGMFNEAMLILPINEEWFASVGNDTTKIPSTIVCYRRNAEGSLVYISDALLSSSSYMGHYDASIKAYRMRITSHLQNFLTSSIPSADMYIIPDSKTSTATRVVLNGPKHPTKPARIQIIYTR